MFSWFLKFFLYLVLTVCLLLSATVLFGPRLLSVASTTYFGNTVIFSGLKITPKLELYASSLELKNFQVEELGNISGKVRSISVKLQDLFSDHRRAEISVGPTEINGFGSVQNLSLSVLPSSPFNFQNLKFSVKTNEIKQKAGFALGNFDFEGEWIRDSEVFQNINFQGSSLALNDQFETKSESFSGTVWTLGVGGGELNLDFSTSFLSPQMLERNLKASRLDLSGNIGNKKPELSINIYQSRHNTTGFYVENADIFLSGSQLSKGIWDFISFDLETIKPSESAFISGGSGIKNLAGKITKSDQTSATYDLNAKLDYFELVYNKQILADISFFDFESAGKVVMDEASTRLDAQMIFAKSEKSQLELSAVFGADIIFPISGECKYINCGLRNLRADWMLEASDQSLEGVSDCLLFNCISSQHTLETNDTKKFFEELIAVKIFNPIALSLFYRQIMEGEKVGLGHLLALDIK